MEPDSMSAMEFLMAFGSKSPSTAESDVGDDDFVGDRDEIICWVIVLGSGFAETEILPMLDVGVSR